MGKVSMCDAPYVTVKDAALGATSTSTVLSTPVKRREYRAAQVEAFNRYG